MAEFIIDDVHFVVNKVPGIDKYVIKVDEDFGDLIEIDCTLEQIDTLGKGLVAFAATKRGI